MGGACSAATEALCDVIIGGLGGLGVIGRGGDDLDICICLGELRQEVSYEDTTTEFNAGRRAEERTKTIHGEEATHENLLRSEATLPKDPSSLLSSAPLLL